MIRISYIDADGDPATGGLGVNTITREYTGRGQVSKEQYFDANGNPALVNGACGIATDYTPFGNIEKETWLDADEQLVRNSEGYASVRYEYDLTNASRVEKITKFYLDENGDPCAADNGAWGVLTLYYPAGRVHEVTFLGENGDPTNSKDGYAILEYEEDENGNRVWEGYYAQDHSQVNCAEGYFSKESEYDSEGRLIAERYLDFHNKLTNNAEGTAGWNGYYDAEGNLVVTNRYDQERKALPTENP